MLLSFRLRNVMQLMTSRQGIPSLLIAFQSSCQSLVSLENDTVVDRLTRLINDHPFPELPLQPALSEHVPTSVLTAPVIQNVLGRLFAAHTNGLKAYEFFKFSLEFPHLHPTSDAFEKTLHILTRMRYFAKAWKLMEEIAESYPSLLSLKSMSIMLSKIAKFQSYEDTLAAFERMENSIFIGRKFGTDEFNILLRAFCTQRQMKEAKSVFRKMYSRFPSSTKTMNILLLGFKDSGVIDAVELFYHEIVKRGFKPNSVTYNIRIDAYCKSGCFGDGLRLLQEMERKNCLPTLETITTLIHGAGIARNLTRAWELFNELPARNLQPDIGLYNALISSLVKCRDVQSGFLLMDEMEEKHIGSDNVTYHTMFYGLMRSKGIDGVIELYNRMIGKKLLPKTRTVVMLMKFFCVNSRVDMGLHMWEYMIESGCCPHEHALALLVTGLCSHGRVQEAFECCRQMLSRGRNMSKPMFCMLERFLLQNGELDKVRILDEMIRKLQSVYVT